MFWIPKNNKVSCISNLWDNGLLKMTKEKLKQEDCIPKGGLWSPTNIFTATADLFEYKGAFFSHTPLGKIILYVKQISFASAANIHNTGAILASA